MQRLSAGQVDLDPVGLGPKGGSHVHAGIQLRGATLLCWMGPKMGGTVSPKSVE